MGKKRKQDKIGTKRTYSDEIKEKALSMCKSMEAKHVAKKLGIPYGTVWGWYNKEATRSVKEFPFTKDTKRHLCIWHYTDGGFDRLCAVEGKTDDKYMSIYYGIPMQRIREIVYECMNDGSYDKYIDEYKSYSSVVHTLKIGNFNKQQLKCVNER